MLVAVADLTVSAAPPLGRSPSFLFCPPAGEAHGQIGAGDRRPSCLPPEDAATPVPPIPWPVGLTLPPRPAGNPHISPRPRVQEHSAIPPCAATWSGCDEWSKAVAAGWQTASSDAYSLHSSNSHRARPALQEKARTYRR